MAQARDSGLKKDPEDGFLVWRSGYDPSPVWILVMLMNRMISRLSSLGFLVWHLSLGLLLSLSGPAQSLIAQSADQPATKTTQSKPADTNWPSFHGPHARGFASVQNASAA